METGTLSWSPESADVLGVTPEQLGSTLAEYMQLVHADDRERVRTEHINFLAGGSMSRSFCFRFIRNDGEVRWVRAYGESLPARAERSRQLLGIVQDITESKAATDALLATERRFRRIVETALEGIWTIDALGRTTFVNTRMAAMLGLEAEDLFSRSVREFIDGKSKRDVDGQIQGSTLGASLRGEAVLRANDGRFVSTMLQTSPFFDAQGQADGVLLMVTDITERKAAEERLRSSEQRYRFIFETSSPMWLCEPESMRFIEVNDAAMQLYGYSRDEFLTMSMSDVRPRDEGRLAELLRAADEGARVFLPATHRRKEGTAIAVELTGRRLRLEGREVWLVVANDITERRKLQERLLHSQKMEAVGRLAGGIAHDFNNILGVIIATADHALSGPSVDRSVRSEIEEMGKAARRAADLTQQLLQFSRRGGAVVGASNVDDVLSDMERMLSRVIGEDVALILQTEAKGAAVEMSRAQLEQVVMNLVVNARDAMPEGGVMTITTRTGRVEEADAAHQGISAGPYVELTVTDTGCGMDSSTKVRIFDPFFTTKEVGKGTGLGLSTVFGIVEQCRGTIRVDSSPSKGTTFVVRLPFMELPRDAAAAPLPQPKESPTGGATIVLVEDDDQLRAVIVRILKQAGYVTIPARDGREALQIIEREGDRVDLVLSDLVMPGMDGRTLARRLRDLSPSLQILHMSGYAEHVALRGAALDPTTPLLRKPFTADEVREAVRAALKKAH